MDITNSDIIINTMFASILIKIVVPLILLVFLPFLFVKDNLR